MKRRILSTLLCCVCAAVPIAAQTAVPEGMAQIPAGKFWMGRAYSMFLDSADLLPRDKMDDRPANSIYLDSFYIDKYEVTNADYARFVEATGARDAEIDRGEERLLAPQTSGRITSTAAPAVIGRRYAMAVGSFTPNGYGLYDMTGNVMEWTNDWYDGNYYPFMPKQNPKGPETGRYRSVRGAGFFDQGGHGEEKTVNYRNFSDPDLRSTTIGFRCAK